MDDIFTAGLASAGIVWGATLFARRAIPALALDTPRAKLGTMLLALCTGLALGAAGVAPPVGDGIAGALAGGFLSATLAVFGRDFFSRGRDAVRPTDVA